MSKYFKMNANMQEKYYKNLCIREKFQNFMN